MLQLSPVRSLVLAQDFPWPPSSGSFLRLVNVIDALGELGDVDVFATVFAGRNLPCELPASGPVARWATASYPRADYSLGRRARWLAGRLPLEVVAQRLEGPAAQLSRWAKPPYDLVWCSKTPTFVGLGRPRLGPCIVDFDDLEDHKITARLEGGSLAASYPRSLTGQGRRWMATGQARLNAGRWRQLQAGVAAQVQRVVVCSQLDAERVKLPNACIVPNGYDPPGRPLGRLEVNAPPTLLFQGVLHYGPNADAARWLVDSIGPRLRHLVPDAEIRLVGAPNPPIRRLADPPRVHVVGWVPEMAPELARADVVVVPLRYGSGTRVKALEAFAHRIPVVSTTLGAEGLGAIDGRHLLLADTVEDFAAACARLLTDVGLRERLVEEAHRLLVSQHRWELARRAVVDLAHAVTAARPNQAVER